MSEKIISSSDAVGLCEDGTLTSVSTVVTEDAAGIVSLTTTNHRTGTVSSYTPDQSVGTCELCHTKNQDLRPYGPNNENICFKCGMKHQEITFEKFKEYVDKKSIDISTT